MKVEELGRERRWGIVRWAIIMGAVRLVVTSVAMEDGEVVEGVVKEREDWMPAIVMMVLMVGWEVRRVVMWVGRRGRLEVSIWGVLLGGWLWEMVDRYRWWVRRFGLG